MKYGSPDFALFLVDGVDLLPAKLQRVMVKREARQQRVDGLGDRVTANGPTGLTVITLEQAGAFFDDTANGMHTAFKSDTGQSRTVQYSFDGGKTVTTIAGVYRESYSVIAQQEHLTRANVTYQVNGIPVDGGRLLQGTESHTASWVGAVVDLGAAIPGGATITTTVVAVRDGSIAGIVEHSDDGLTGWTTIATFPAIAGAPATQSQVVAGAIKRYVRYSGTIGTPGAAPLARVAVILTPT